MIEKKKAEEYAKRECENRGWCDLFIEDESRRLKQAYLAGLAEGKPKWHDLRKNPEDFPKYNEEDSEDNFYLVAFRNCFDKEEIVTKAFIWNGDEFCEEDYGEIPYFRKQGVLLAWCELPKFI